MRYEDFVRRICGENWKSEKSDRDERDGGYGVAITVAFLRGCKPTVGEMSAHLGVPADEVIAAFTRLSRNGVFSPYFNAKNDQSLGNNLEDPDVKRSWGHIAGTASGFIGV